MKQIYGEAIPEIRLVPFAWNGFSGNTISEIQEDFRANNYIEYTRNIIAEENALLLFRTKGMIFASALFSRKKETSDDEYPYLIFYYDLNLFSPQISTAELAAIDPGVKTGTRSVRRLDINKKAEILNLLTVKGIQSKPASEKGCSQELTATEVEQIVKVRVGQSQFRKGLMLRDSSCNVCGLSIEELLYASHIKPWKESTDEEKLDLDNGLLLCSVHNDLFDKFMITFGDDGKIIISENINKSSYGILCISSKAKIRIFEGQKKYLRWHRRRFSEKSDKD